jgi:hypothetical protein
LNPPTKYRDEITPSQGGTDVEHINRILHLEPGKPVCNVKLSRWSRGDAGNDINARKKQESNGLVTSRTALRE